MGTRGPKSASELAVSSPSSPIVHADAPYDLSDEQAEIWRATLASLPPDWIEVGAHPTLAAFCRTTTHLRRLGQIIHQAETEGDDFDPTLYGKMVAAHGQAAQVIKTLSTALRLTPQTRTRHETAGRRAGTGVAKRPWE